MSVLPSFEPLPNFSRAKILVVGDVMLDRYWFGDVNRISPEAPVPVLKVERVEERPGGAANVARNIASLGAHSTLLSVVGADEAGDCLERLLTQHGNVNALLHRDSTISTTIKLRAVARHQQLLRIDFETQPSHEVLNAKLADFRAKLPDADVVILSDYGKGGLTHISEMIELARAAGKPVLVDPKGDDYTRYAGATLLTPNRSEFREVAGGWKSEAELNAKAERLRSELKLDALLVTRSEEGMSLYRANEIVHEPTQSREVFDVSGAGDTVIATLAVMLACGADWSHAVRIANRAAGIVVGKLGTAMVSRDEIIQDMKRQDSVIRSEK
ncbi:MAG: D-glycero-beta-D-manno-heptose-7-phosphate kinase [Gallionellales bacterium 35-53-114]|jgi:rfaE bifunctional protein kinase chain/domain|nr:MAG: D-glycero-beta-D-manno-heptose-7-phosphate kinase [Gallionellales bacterium 35-53-114]OYZ65329.1 MAG: D-glycero-beta-D-manno-heptose-7-phosphate kinase [Gallionellales bacterium 24-53-125]OZB08236.1 MAG: D-glycero-beta-D-manno-heptose-7-phosphate kinase [Gallionellales bacterium 39-52-133]HQS58166.1 D-glycero-beta-D-manno-heptose-7-phosphate kinase [Gallionellaceae bacterium]HQS73721.1 D-glycero-beta-D-manno-heptose-7-phosphate kinase [Gallionellaceae bacterium]